MKTLLIALTMVCIMSMTVESQAGFLFDKHKNVKHEIQKIDKSRNPVEQVPEPSLFVAFFSGFCLTGIVIYLIERKRNGTN